jgi:Right handed beta helix region
VNLGAFVLSLALAAATHGSSPVYVDQSSVGGACSDARTALQADFPKRPLCSLERALATAPANSTVMLRRGTYSSLTIEGLRRKGRLEVWAYPGEHASVEEVSVEDSDNVAVVGLEVRNGFSVNGSGQNLTFVGNDIGHQPQGMVLYGYGGRGLRDLLIAGNSIHDIDYPQPSSPDGVAGYGIRMMGTVRDTTIRGNTIRSVVEDYIQGGESGITVERNTFLGPSLRYDHSDDVHADLWQIYWPSKDIVFRSNIARRTGTQNGLLFQFSAPGPPHRDVVIENNLFDHASDGTEMQIYNTRGLTIANNTAIGSSAGTWLRVDDRVPRGSGYRVVNNIFDSKDGTPFEPEVDWGVEKHNVITSRGGLPRRTFDRTDVVGRSPSFVAARTGDYRLERRSLGVDDGTSLGAPRTDLTGARRDSRPDVGAFERP